MLIMEVDAMPGDLIDDVCAEAIDLNRKLGVCVRFSFNGVRMFVHGRSSTAALVAEYDKRLRAGDLVA